METMKEFRYNKSLVKRSLLLSFFVLLTGIIFLYITNEFIPTIFVVGIVLLILTLLKFKLKVIKIFDDYFELRLKIFAPVKLIQNKRLVNYSIEDNKLIIFYISYDETVDTITIFENCLGKNDFDELLLFLITIKEENSIRVVHSHDKDSILKEAI